MAKANPGLSGVRFANPVNAGIVGWADGYEWRGFAAACAGDEVARAVTGDQRVALE